MIVRSVRIAAAEMLPALAWGGMPDVRAAEEKPPVDEKSESTEGKAKKSPVDYRGPLPLYYVKVASPDQKEKIYAVQEKYDEQLRSLMTQVKALQAQRDKEIDALLSPDQLKRLEEIRAEAAEAKKSKKPAEGDAAPKKAAAGE